MKDSYSTRDSDTESAVLFYIDIMHEIKYRHAVLSNTCMVFEDVGINPRIELGFLQIRKICELLALGLVGINLPALKGRSRLLDEYDARALMKSLERAHPNFYPKPIRHVPTTGGIADFDLQVIDPPYLTKDNLLHAYVRSGEMLHIGKLKNWKEPRQKSSLEEIGLFGRDLKTLLDQHVVPYADSRIIFLVQMNGNIKLSPTVSTFADIHSSDDLLGVSLGSLYRRRQFEATLKRLSSEAI